MQGLLFSKTVYSFFFFLQKVDVSCFVKPCKVFVFLKLCNLVLHAKSCSLLFCKTMQCLFFKTEQCCLSLAKGGNLLFCKTMHCLPSTLAQSNTVTVSEYSPTPVVKVVKAMGKLMNTGEQPTARREARKRREHTESQEERGQQNKQHRAPRPRAPGAGNQRKQETKGARGKQQRKKKAKRRRGGQTKDQERGKPSPVGALQSRKTKRPKEKVRRIRARPGGRPARPGQDGRAHAHTHGTRVWRPPTRKGRCRRPHETAPLHRRSPPSRDGRYGKPDMSVTGSPHANNRSARSPRPTPEGPARDNPIAGPRTGTTRSKPSAPASAGASGRHNEPSSRPASACPAQPPSKARGASPRGGERHHGVGKADRSTQSDRTGRGAAHHAGPRGTPERHAAGHDQGTRTGAKQQWPPGAANPESAHNTQRTTARGQVPSNTSAVWTDVCAPGSEPSRCRLRNSPRPDGRVCARRVPSPCRLRTAAVWMDE